MTYSEVDDALSVAQLVRLLRARDASPREVLADHLRRLEGRPRLNAFLWADPERLLAAAPNQPVNGRPLAGLPIAVKDNIDTAGIPTTSGSLVDRDRVPLADAAVWRQLRDDAGAVLLGKAHLCEFAYRSHHPALGWVRNPHDTRRATGGSSSGSAAAVAAGIAPAALGTDSGGSVRIPASYCGVVGLKGTFGLIATSGVVPLSKTLDHVGVLARSVADAAIVFQEMATSRLRLIDPLTLHVEVPAPRALRVGIETDYFASGAQPAVAASVSSATAALSAAGCQIVEVALPEAAAWRAGAKVILLYEAWQYHAARLTAGAPYGPVFRTAVEAGADLPADAYRKALDVRSRARESMNTLFAKVDVILTPTCPTIAPAIEEGRRSVAYNRYTTLAAFTGIPAISVPIGLGHLGLPIGAQLMAAPGAERTLVGAAALLESEVSPSTPFG